MKILLAEQAHAHYAELLQAAQPHLQLVAGNEPQTLLAEAASCSVWLGQPDLLQPLLRAGYKPAWLQSTWAGITPLLAPGLPQDYLLSRAVGIFGQVMAEYVLTYLLGHRRRLLARLGSQAEQRWDNQLPASLRGVKVLIVGAGDIGQQVAQFLAPFGVELRGIAREPRAIAPFAEVHGLAALGEQAGWADCLVNLLPDTPATRDIYDAALFARMAKQALFINAGRGVAVVDDALLAALRGGLLAGAVIDVCRQEPLPPGHPFWDAPHLLLTGHSSAPTDPVAMAALFLDNLQRYRQGQALRGQVDFARGY
ncbi:MAG TPA: D-2-hydroxyacid dehydrogenase [Pseudomonas sp.]|nr:D-2-hydroxyacid dehydrogenase [Pseudomonas sp.]